jgi:hypothetical protein
LETLKLLHQILVKMKAQLARNQGDQPRNDNLNLYVNKNETHTQPKATIIIKPIKKLFSSSSLNNIMEKKLICKITNL